MDTGLGLTKTAQQGAPDLMSQRSQKREDPAGGRTSQSLERPSRDLMLLTIWFLSFEEGDDARSFLFIIKVLCSWGATLSRTPEAH